VIIVFLFSVLLVFLTWFAKLPIGILGYYATLSLITYVVYAVDKSASRKGTWRTSEKTLHALSLLGGWPGGLIAQQKLRHKSKKRSFRTVFWITVCMNIGIFFWLFGKAVFSSP